MQLQEKVRSELVDRVILHGQPLAAACAEMSIPLPVVLTLQQSDARVAMAVRVDQKRSNEEPHDDSIRFADTSQLKQRFAQALQRKGKFFDKIVRLSEISDVEDKTGRETILTLLRHGVLRDLLPKEHSAEVNLTSDPLKSKSYEELKKIQLELLERNQKLLTESKEAAEMRRRGEVKVIDVDFKEIDRREA